LHPVATTLYGTSRQHVVDIMSRRVLAGVIVISVFRVKSGLSVRLIVAFRRLLRRILVPALGFGGQHVHGAVLLVTIRLNGQERAGRRARTRGLLDGFA